MNLISPPPVVPLTIFRIRKGVLDPDRIISSRTELEDFAIRTKDGLLGILYVEKSSVHRPRWVDFFKSAVDVGQIPAKSSSSAALLHVQRSKQAYLIAFGYGRKLIEPGIIDERFGLRAALNAIDPERIRSIDRKTFEAVSIHSREQVSRESSISEFGLDVERDLLRAVTGSPTDATLGRRLAGMDALAVAVSQSLDGLGALLDRYGELSEKNDYKVAFPWVDNLAEVTDEGQQVVLDEAVASRIKKSDTATIWLAPLDIIDWADTGGFMYRSAKGGKIFEDLQLEDYLQEGRSRKELTAETLKKDRVRLLNAGQDDVVKTWSVRNCLCAEVDKGGLTYVLSDGKWYRVNKDFLAEIDQAVGRLPQVSLKMPQFNDKDEGEYNKRVARANKPDIALMDKQLVPAGPGRGGIEFCDLYDRRGTLLHIKRYGSSSALSHLFGQGTVSARLFAFDVRFRQKLNEKLPATHRLADPKAPVSTGDFEVAFVVLGTAGPSARLPFFSRVNLRTHCEALSGWGYRVSLTLVQK